MRSNIRIITLLLLGVISCFGKSNFLGETRIADLFTCVKDLQKATQVFPDISAAIKLKLYSKALQELQIVLCEVDTAIQKCAEGTCWMEGQQRCENEKDQQCEKWGLLWYPVCKSGYHNNACCICSQDCPNGFRDDGADCFKPSSYGRGAGYPWDFGDPMNLDKAMARCLKENPTLGCEQYGAIIYPKCRENFHNAGCCVCSPNCPSGMTDIGVSCQKQTYGRGVGFDEGKCISENWNDFTPIEKYGECTDMAEQIAIDIDLVMESIDDKDRKIVTIKRAYILLQHAGPFLEHCAEKLKSLILE